MTLNELGDTNLCVYRVFDGYRGVCEYALHRPAGHTAEAMSAVEPALDDVT